MTLSKNWFDAQIQLEKLEIKILKNWKTKKWLTTSPFFKRGKNRVFYLKNWISVDFNLKNWNIVKTNLKNWKIVELNLKDWKITSKGLWQNVLDRSLPTVHHFKIQNY